MKMVCAPSSAPVALTSVRGEPAREHSAADQSADHVPAGVHQHHGERPVGQPGVVHEVPAAEGEEADEAAAENGGSPGACRCVAAGGEGDHGEGRHRVDDGWPEGPELSYREDPALELAIEEVGGEDLVEEVVGTPRETKVAAKAMRYRPAPGLAPSCRERGGRVRSLGRDQDDRREVGADAGGIACHHRDVTHCGVCVDEEIGQRSPGSFASSS